jgi:hypothetical protein
MRQSLGERGLGDVKRQCGAPQAAQFGSHAECAQLVDSGGSQAGLAHNVGSSQVFGACITRPLEQSDVCRRRPPDQPTLGVGICPRSCPRSLRDITSRLVLVAPVLRSWFRVGGQTAHATIQRMRRPNNEVSLGPVPRYASSGSERIRVPVAMKIAFATAGATATIGVSPAPAEGMSGRSRRTTSIGGTSVKRGTR